MSDGRDSSQVGYKEAAVNDQIDDRLVFGRKGQSCRARFCIQVLTDSSVCIFVDMV